MKANEAPEKIYLTPLECMAASYQPKKDNTIEYTRADAFIDKACEFISLNAADYIDVTHKGGIEHLALQERFIDKFKNYMKGE